MGPDSMDPAPVRVRLCWWHLLAQLWATVLDMPTHDGLVGPSVNASVRVQDRALACPRCLRRVGPPTPQPGQVATAPVWNPSSVGGASLAADGSWLPPAGRGFGDARPHPGRSIDVGWVILGTVLGTVAVAVAASGVWHNVRSAPDPAPPTNAAVSLEDLHAGDCVRGLSSGPEETAPETVKVVPCSKPHTDEVIGTYPILGSRYPGERRARVAADRGCNRQFESYVGISPAKSSLGTYVSYPSAESWVDSHVALCAVYFTQSVSVGSLKDTGALWSDPSELAIGTCARDATPSAQEITTLRTPCSAAHDFEVFAKFVLPDQTYPGPGPVEKLATDGCTNRFRRYVGIPLRSSVLDSVPWWPLKASWAKDRGVTCLLHSATDVTGSLRDSRH